MLLIHLGNGLVLEITLLETRGIQELRDRRVFREQLVLKVHKDLKGLHQLDLQEWAVLQVLLD
jgi:hypothetical protein